MYNTLTNPIDIPRYNTYYWIHVIFWAPDSLLKEEWLGQQLFVVVVTSAPRRRLTLSVGCHRYCQPLMLHLYTKSNLHFYYFISFFYCTYYFIHLYYINFHTTELYISRPFDHNSSYIRSRRIDSGKFIHSLTQLNSFIPALDIHTFFIPRTMKKGVIWHLN